MSFGFSKSAISLVAYLPGDLSTTPCGGNCKGFGREKPDFSIVLSQLPAPIPLCHIFVVRRMESLHPHGYQYERASLSVILAVHVFGRGCLTMV